LRDGFENDDFFFIERGKPCTVRYKRQAAYETKHRALKRKKIGFFGHVTRQVSGLNEKRSSSEWATEQQR
jgi:hypothetical protein